MKFDDFDLFLYLWKQKALRENYRKILISFPWKKKHPWKNPKKCQWKLWAAREEVEKSVRESDFSIREKSPKKAKNGFNGHFWFSRRKKKTLRCIRSFSK